MIIITDSRCTSYEQPGHPERPARISATVERLREQPELSLHWAEPVPITEDQLRRAHTNRLLERLSVAHDFDADTPAHPDIRSHAERSAGGAVRALDAALAGETAFSLLRPPGHHATTSEAMGFCYLNSIAIAALEARARGCERVAVFDFDVHHGNGTEDILMGREGCAFFSVHQFPAYPGTGECSVQNAFNYPVAPGSSLTDYRAALQRALNDLRNFRPNVVGVSAGFDAYRRDPVGGAALDTEDYHWLGREIRAIGVPMFHMLEGGYSRHLPELVLAYLKGLAGLSL
jgi:acetoin utilization deacetylase AcuC-like enzyme